MSAQRLYKAVWEYDAEGTRDISGVVWDLAAREPEGWREYALEMWGDTPREGEHWPHGHKPFFFPSTDKIYRSRSAAQRRVDLINYWGGNAVLVECTPVWETVEAANARRERERLHSRIMKKRAELAALVAKAVA